MRGTDEDDLLIELLLEPSLAESGYGGASDFP